MQLKIYEKKQAVAHMDLGLYSGDIHVAIPPMTGHPTIHWKGAVMPREVFREAVAFLKWTHDRHQVEGQARFYYNELTGEWKTVALPQYIWSAGHTREVEADDPVKEAIIEKLLLAGFGEAGTIHHHSGMSAFQSGGDKEDELARNGFHVTIGGMSGKVASFHARVTFRGINYEGQKGMMYAGQWLPGLRTTYILGSSHKPLHADITKYWLSLEDLPKFPQVWESYMVDKPVVVTTPVTTRHAHNCHSTALMGRNQATSQAHETASERARRLHLGEVPIYKDKHITIWLSGGPAKDGFKILPRAPVEETKGIEAPRQDNRKEDASVMLPTVNELREMRAMTVPEFEKYLSILRDEKRIDESNCAETLKSRLSQDLGEFRDAFIGEQLSPKELKELFGDIQTVSTRMVRIISTLVTTYENKNDQTTKLPIGSEMRELLGTWINKLSEIIVDLHPEEWEAMDNASMAIDKKEEYNFYKMMCDGLMEGIDTGVIQDLYDKDGEVSYRHRTAHT
jgi:hypothetical protein